MKYFIKNMLTLRCKMIVRAELESMGLHCIAIELGEVEIKEQLSINKYVLLKAALGKSGLELMDDKKTMLVEKIKNVIIEMIHYADEPPDTKISVYISQKLNYDYTYLSNIFSEIKGITINQFVLMHKIEKVKELIVYDELNLTEIANKMHYSSAHLSNQFKKLTGYTPSCFRKMKNKRRKTLDDI